MHAPVRCILEHQVGRREVAVDDSSLMGLVQHITKLAEDLGRPVEWHGDARFEQLLDAAAVDDIHDNVNDMSLCVDIGIVNDHGVGMS